MVSEIFEVVCAAACLLHRLVGGAARGRAIVEVFIFAAAGVAWSEDEHRLFLLGLQKLGKVRRVHVDNLL